VPWLVLLVLAAATGFGTVFVAQTLRARDQLRFTGATQDFRLALQARIDTYVALLRAGSALFAANDVVTRNEFHAFIDHLDLPARFPGIQGIGFAAAVPRADVPALVADMRQQGVDDFHVWPFDPRREFYTSIVFLEPLDLRNRAALGFDMFSEPTRRAAMERARDTGAPAASGKVTLKQEIDPEHLQAGFLIYFPVYRAGATPPTPDTRAAALQGFVYAPFRAGDLLGTLLGTADRVLAVRIFDGPAASPDRLFYDSAPTDDLVRTRFHSTVQFPVAGRPWTVQVLGRPDFGGASPLIVPTMATLGMVIAVVLFLLTRSEVRARAAAEASTRALQASEEDLRAANRAKDEFLATLSHELRTPLNAILGWARMLRLGQVSVGRRVQALAVIERNARALAQLVEDLLDVSRIITGKLRLDRSMVSLNTVTEHAVATVRPAADAKGVTLEWSADPLVGIIHAAGDRLQQVVWNLLSNAVKFTPSGGRVELITRRHEDEVEIAVRDTGVGIAPGFLPHVFERFRQADSTTTRTHSGVGLGLAIVRHLVELHGGTIEAASEGEGRGATFTVKLPARRVGSSEPVLESSPAGWTRSDAMPGRRLDGVRVLVVDDEQDARELAQHVLEHEGASVQTAASVEEAMMAVERVPFDVLVADLAMPGNDGFALVRRLRAEGSAQARGLPVIAVTASARQADRDRVMTEGFQGFLGKPLDPEGLADVVAVAAGRGGEQTA